MHELKKGKKKIPPHPLIRRNPKKQIIKIKRGRARNSIHELAAERGISFTAARKKYFADRKKLLNFFAP